MGAPPPGAGRRLAGTGLVVNPSWTVETDLAALLPALARVLGQEGPATFRLERLTTKNSQPEPVTSFQCDGIGLLLVAAGFDVPPLDGGRRR